MIKLAIVEDEQIYRDQLKEYLFQYEQESGNEFLITCFDDGEDITENYKTEYDIILLDIQMRFMDGMKTAEIIRQKDPEVIIMFITNMTQYAVKGYEVDALDYVLKPVTYFAFTQKLDRAIERMKKRSDFFLMLQMPDGLLKLDIAKLLYVECQSHTLFYHTRTAVFSARGRMEDIEKKLSDYGFFRSNKGYLVNLRYVERVQDNCCIIAKERLAISRRRKNEFMEAMVNYVSEVRK